MAKLTAKQEMFCREYLIDLNATQAAIRAGYSVNTAREIGCENLTKPNVSKCIQELMAERVSKVTITAQDVINDIIDTRDTCKGNMSIQGDYEGKLYSASVSGRNKANEMLGRHIGMFNDKLEISGTTTIIVGDIDD